jgi:hypothetical protein
MEDSSDERISVHRGVQRRMAEKPVSTDLFRKLARSRSIQISGEPVLFGGSGDPTPLRFPKRRRQR